ncbi:MAG: FAD binding domain-containing protein [bacterium]|nr:MAG: FAD binding domain-containing protein [bacterium]
MTDRIDIISPVNLAQLDHILEKLRKPATYVAGATDIMVQKSRWEQAGTLIDLRTVQELVSTLEIGPEGILIGAALSFTDIIRYRIIQEKFPILVESCRQIGSVQIQNRATLGGNIANASPAGDTLPVLAVLNAELWIGPRLKDNFTKMSVDEIMTGPGKNCLQPNQYIAYIYLPFPEPTDPFWYFRKVGQRYSMAISKLSLAVLGWKHNNHIREIRICAGSVSPRIKRAVLTEKLLSNQELNSKVIEKAATQLMKEIKPITDIRSTHNYRKSTAGRLLQESLSTWARAGK